MESLSHVVFNSGTECFSQGLASSLHRSVRVLDHVEEAELTKNLHYVLDE